MAYQQRRWNDLHQQMLDWQGKKVRPRRLDWLRRYGAAVLLTAVALALGSIFKAWLGSDWPLITLYGAVALTALYAGSGPALLTAVGGFLLSHHLFAEPRGSLFAMGDFPSAVTAYLISSASMIVFGEMAYRRQREACRLTHALDRKARKLEHEAEDRRAAELAIREAYRRLSSILASVGDCYAAVDRQWRIVEFNPPAERFFGRSRESVLGQVIWDVFPQGRGTAIEANYRRAMNEGIPIEFEVISPTVGKWVEISAYPAEEGLSVFFRDINERKRADAAVRLSEQLLARSQAATHVGSYVVELAGSENRSEDRVTWSEELYRIYGLEPGEIRLTLDYIFSRIHPDDQQRVASIMQEGIRALQPYELEHRIVRADGVRVLRLWSQFDLDSAGRLTRIWGTCQDITERKRLENELRETIEKLAKADRRKDEFLATLAHELRNPLAPIRNAVQILKTPGAGESHQAWSREVIDRQVRQMARLLDDLLDISRVTRGKLELRKELISIQSAVEAAIETSRPLIETRSHSLQVELPVEPIQVQVDPVRMTQILGNLLNNAAKYTDSGGQIHIRAASEGQEVVISVRDNGRGMTAESCSRLFEMFTQARETLDRAEGGLGVGLALTRGLVEMHGGRIEAHSEGPGRGSEFIVHLPRAAG